MALEKHAIRDGVVRAFPPHWLRKNRRFGQHRGTERRGNVPAAIPLIGGGTGGEKLHHARTTAMVEMAGFEVVDVMFRGSYLCSK